MLFPYLHKKFPFNMYVTLRDTTRSIVVIQVKIYQAEKTIEILLLRPTEVCDKVYSEKNGLKSVKTSL